MGHSIFAALFIEIKTFHSYCFDLLGKIGTIEKSDEIIKEAVKRIKCGEVEAGKITKTVLVIDEAQDMDADESELVEALMEYNEDMRVIAVGDDDQNIFEFRGSSSRYMVQIAKENKAVMYELVENYRSKSNIVDFSNQFVRRISHRLKETPIVAVQNDDGRIKVVKYSSTHLITPLVNDILSEGLAGTACVLTRTNEEALQITGLLVKNGMQAKLIQSNDGFNLYNLFEIRFFLEQLNLAEVTYTIDEETWANAKKRMADNFRESPNLELCINIIKDFELTNPKSKYKSDLEIFIRKSKLEDFYGGSTETVFVSTIHKAKGREFDNVFLMLDRYGIESDEVIRLLYVAMTRAKRNLTIHYNGYYLDSIITTGFERVYDKSEYPPPEQLAVQLTHRDVWLDYFIKVRQWISQLYYVELLTVDGDYCRNSKGQRVLRFSKQFIERIEDMKRNDYLPERATIRFIVYRQKEGSEQENRIVLPELIFKRVTDNNAR